MTERRFRILMLDDECVPGQEDPIDAGYMGMYREYLESEKRFTVTLCQTFRDALEYLDQEPFDLIFLDLMMSQASLKGTPLAGRGDDDSMKTGLSIAIWLNQHHWKTPVIILTNVTQPKTRRRLLDLQSVRNILVKPDNSPIEILSAARILLGLEAS